MKAGELRIERVTVLHDEAGIVVDVEVFNDPFAVLVVECPVIVESPDNPNLTPEQEDEVMTLAVAEVRRNLLKILLDN